MYNYFKMIIIIVMISNLGLNFLFMNLIYKEFLIYTFALSSFFV